MREIGRRLPATGRADGHARGWACDLRSDLGGRRLGGQNGERLEDFAGQSRLAVLCWIVACFRAAGWRCVLSRRVDLRDLPEPDVVAMAIAMRAVEGRDRAATLRAVLAGSAVTQAIATKWVGESRWPRCLLEDKIGTTASGGARPQRPRAGATVSLMRSPASFRCAASCHRVGNYRDCRGRFPTASALLSPGRRV